MVIPTPDNINVLVVAISLVVVPDAVRFVKQLMFVKCVATSAPSDILVMLKPMTVAFVKYISSMY